jgi:hypothetical protein
MHPPPPPGFFQKHSAMRSVSRISNRQQAFYPEIKIISEYYPVTGSKRLDSSALQ